MVPCHSCHIHGGEGLKSSFGVASHKSEEQFLRGEEGSLYNTTILKLYCKSYWVLLTTLLLFCVY